MVEASMSHQQEGSMSRFNRDKNPTPSMHMLFGYPFNDLTAIAHLVDEFGGVDATLKHFYELKFEKHRLTMIKYEEKLTELNK